MPRHVWIERNDMIILEIVWTKEEWCRRIPRIWLSLCGCRRCCDNLPGAWRDAIEENGFVQILHDGYTWFIRCERSTGKYCIYPWPRRVYNIPW